MVLLSTYFVVFRLAQWVMVAPGKLRRSPPTVTRTRFTSALVGQMEATIWAYVTLRPLGMTDFFCKEDGIGAVGHAGADALGKAS